MISRRGQRWKKTTFLHKQGLKKCINCRQSNFRQNSVKGQKDPKSAKKMPKSNIKFQNVLKTCHQKAKNCNLSYFLDKTPYKLGNDFTQNWIFFTQTLFVPSYVFFLPFLDGVALLVANTPLLTSTHC